MNNGELRGFTLIELLVVIAIIGILSSVVLASLGTARSKSRDARRLSDLKQFRLALELFYDTNKEYPINLSEVAPTYIGSVTASPNGSPYLYDAIQNNGASCDSVGETCVSYVVAVSGYEGTPPPGAPTGTVGTVTSVDCSSNYCVRP